MTWLVEGIGSALPALVGGAVVVAYGLAGARLMGVRSWLLALVAAVPIAVALLVIAAEIVGILGVDTPIAADAAIGLGLAAVLGLLVLLERRRRPTQSGDLDPGRLVWIGIAIGTLVTLGVWISGIGDHGLPPQAHDDIWHGYLVERLTQMPIITAGTVAPTSPNSLQPTLFYQYGIHMAWAFGHTISGVSVAEMLNGGWIVHVALLMPAGCAALAWRLFPDRRWVAFWAAVLASSVVVFPYLTNGLLPYTASLAMIPGLLALLITHIRGERDVPAWTPALAAVGVFVTHPSGAMVGAIVATLVAIEIIVRSRRRDDAIAVTRRIVTVGGIAAVAASPWLLAAGERGLGVAPAVAEVDVGTAIWHVLVLGTPWTSPQPVVAAMVAVGIVVTVIGRRGVGLAASYLIFASLLIGTMAGLGGVAAVTQAWHAHWYRVAAAVGVMVPVLAGLGLASAIAVVRRRIGVDSNAQRRLAGAATTAIVLVAVIGGAYASAQGQSIVRDAWHSRQLVQTSDIRLFRKLSELLGPEDRVFNSPRDGSGWMYALYGVVPRHPYAYGTPQWSWDLVNGLDGYGDPRTACAGLADEEVTYAVVKGVTGEFAGADGYDIDGFVERHPDLFIEVARTESAVAYRIDQEALRACIEG